MMIGEKRRRTRREVRKGVDIKSSSMVTIVAINVLRG
jgi:hypothetical protein